MTSPDDSVCRRLKRVTWFGHLFTLAGVLCIWQLSSVVAAADAPQDAQLADYREFALARGGDADRGKAVFLNEQKAGCIKCHSLDGSRRGVGPDLAAVGSKFDRAGLVRSVLEPSASIAIGYGTSNIVTDRGKLYQGVLQRVTDEYVELKDNEAKLVRVPAGEIESQLESSVSLMPVGIARLITRDEFCDLVTFLQSLKQSDLARPQHQGDVRDIERAATGLSFEQKFPALGPWNHPVEMQAIPGRAGQYFVLEQGGRVDWVRLADGSATVVNVLDLHQAVRLGGATGLLGIACHPRFADDPRVFLKYQRIQAGRITTIVEERSFRRTTDDGAELVEPREILTIPAVTQDHNGGSVAFGPDGYLYIGMGDSGPQRDPQGHGQDLSTLLGKIMRIDINHRGKTTAYAIPTNNPFRDDAHARAEVWAYGFREPWRLSFDAVTRELWVGDVGQDRFEEVAIVGRGENHGWNVYEGFAEFSNQYRDRRRADGDFVRPVLSYPRSLGVSVTGGFVYRGHRAPQLRGWYVCGDFESRRIWALKQQDRNLQIVLEIGRLPTRLVSFAVDEQQELCAVGYDDGRIYQLVAEAVNLTPAVRHTLAETSEQTPVLWRYATTEPTKGWTQADFDDTLWRQGPGGFGTAGTPGGEVRSDWRTSDIWIRRAFTLDQDLPADMQLYLRLHHDEDVEVYINGREAARLARWTTGYVEVPLSAECVATLHKGVNTIAIHCHQNSGGQFVDCGIVGYAKSHR